jgi:hypothetical protein
MITITKTFDNAESMEEYIFEYLQDFPIGGYGTMIKEIKAQPVYENGDLELIKYEVTLERAESCD